MVSSEKHGFEQDFSLYAARRKKLLADVAAKHGGTNKHSLIVLWAGFESERHAFRQESSFYYFTGIEEPGVVLVMTMDGKAVFYVPNCATERAQWVASAVPLTQENARMIGADDVRMLGEKCSKYQIYPFFPRAEYATLCALLQDMVQQKGTLFTLIPDNQHAYIEQRFVVERLKQFVPGLHDALIDISPLVAAQRRRKDMREIELMYTAVGITCLAHEAAVQVIEHGVGEAEVQASLEYIMLGSSTRPAFPSIVASGKNGTVLHYTLNNGTLKNGDLVVIDIGADYKGYSADLTRTYPVSGVFTKRQRELYAIVLDTQEHVASKAQPGFWINNKEHPEKSLMHIAKKYLSKYGYEHYFTHGIGHFLGLDVHDVGDYTVPLQEGDVITIEPGIYIPQEGIGIRIEDDYWIVKDKIVCLSEDLPKRPEEIEDMMEQLQSDEEQRDEDIYMEEDEDEESN